MQRNIQVASVRNIPVSDITPSSLNPRKTFDQDALCELADNIKENGLIQPITVRKLAKGENFKYEIVCGERRFRATQIAGMTEIQCIIKDLDDKQAFAAMIIENLQRKDVDPMEEAAAFHKLYTEGTMQVKEIAKILGKSSSYVVSRIQLNNVLPEYLPLLRNGNIYLNQLIEIAKLTKEQQEVLFRDCFTEASIARWPIKYITIDILHQWIDEHVMQYLDTADFPLGDATFSCGKDCEGCPFNTKNKPESYGDTARPRCMDMKCFRQKSLENVFRIAKGLDIPVVYQGQGNEEIIKAAKEYGLTLQDMTGRSYVIKPVEPDHASFSDEEVYEKRMDTYRHVKAIFDSNVEDGNVQQVYEICFDGKLSGEYKYAYTIPADAKDGEDIATSDRTKEQITKLKDSLLKIEEREHDEMVERKRQALVESDYSVSNSVLSAEEQRLFHAAMVKRLPQEFKKRIGLEWSNTEDWYQKAAQVIEENRNAIKREFIKAMLGEKSVCYAHDLQGMLDALMGETMADANKEITEEVSKKYVSQREKIQIEIDKLTGSEE